MQKLAVITGGAGGMGLATAKLLAREHRVLLCDVSQERLRAAADELNGCETVVCDITDRRAVAALAARARELGPVACVVHTAGLSPQMASAEQIIKVNALGTVHVGEAFYAIAEQGFALVNTASMAGHMLPSFLLPTWSYKHASSDPQRFLAWMRRTCNLLPEARRSQIAYPLSKHFTIWYSRTQSARFGAKGARIVSVSPGTFDTAMGRLEADHGATMVAELGALKRVGRVEEIAAVLAFCASEQASYITGTDILCDGGSIANFNPRHARRVAG